MKRRGTPNILAGDQTQLEAAVRTTALVRAVPKARRADMIDRAVAVAREFGDGGAEIDGSSLYPFEAIAASDGLDSYFTKHDVATSLVPIARDFTAGRSVLGNHDYGTFPYGSTFDAEVQDAAVDAPEYEAAFYDRYAGDKRFATSKWVVSHGFITRGLDLNGNKSDSIIRGMETGAVRRVSISFIPGSLSCGIDGIDMIDGFFGAWPDEDEGCSHFPGVDYGEDGVGFALMKNSRGLELSAVYMNASPSAMLKHKAEAMAERGMLRPKDRAAIERLYGRLPAPTKRIWTPGKKEARDVDWEALTIDAARAALTAGEITEDELRANRADLADAIAAEANPPEPPADGDAGETGDGGETGDAGDAGTAPEDDDGAPDGDPAETAVQEFVAASGRIAALAPDALSPERMAVIAAAERSVDGLLGDTGVGGEVARTHEARIRLVTDALGEDLTVSAIRSLKARAEIGDKLFKQQVDEAIRQRVGAAGDAFDREAYERVLLGTDPDYVQKEIASWKDIKTKRFSKDRQVDPPAVRDAAAPRVVVQSPAGSGLASDQKKEAGPNILAAHK